MPVAAGMPPMQVTLRKDPAKGLLGLENWVRWREVMNVHYWRSFVDLESFARNRSDPHFEAWKDFNQRVGAKVERAQRLHRRLGKQSESTTVLSC